MATPSDGSLAGFRTILGTPVAPLAARPEIVIWSINLDQPERVVSDLADILSADEIGAACRLRDDADRIRWISARGALRRILAAELGRDPADLQFAAGSGGKPHLAHDCSLRFNVAHACGLALIAVARDLDVGIDVERIAPLEDLAGTADDIVSPHEAAELRASHDPLAAFYQLWTRKEAYAKAIGGSWDLPVREVEVTVTGRPRFRRLPGDDASAWSLVALDPGPGYVGALAVRHPDVDVAYGDLLLAGAASFPARLTDSSQDSLRS